MNVILTVQNPDSSEKVTEKSGVRIQATQTAGSLYWRSWDKIN